MTSEFISPWGWAGTWQEFLGLTSQAWQDGLLRHHRGRFHGLPLSPEQFSSWDAEFRQVQGTLASICHSNPDSGESLVVFEYELPGEAGRRPDVVFVTPTGHVIVVEFKFKETASLADFDQVLAYARDLSQYHSTTHDLRVHAVLALSRADREVQAPKSHSGVTTATPGPSRRNLPSLTKLLEACLDRVHCRISPVSWIEGEYEPLPSLIQAAVSTFQGHPLPEIKAVRSTQIPRLLDWLDEVCQDSATNHRHVLVLLTGAPGTGKTLVGLQSVVNQAAKGFKAKYLSGNGPLVGVLQYAIDRLHSDRPARSLIRGMMEFKKEVSRSATAKGPANYYVFDEGQRAWTKLKDYDGSEIQLLVDVASRKDWGVVLALIGEGQDIWKNEDGGLEVWFNDFLSSRRHGKEWRVYAPRDLAQEPDSAGPAYRFTAQPKLHLHFSLRSRNIRDLHEWVDSILKGKPLEAKALAEKLHDEGFPAYVSSTRGAAESYLAQRSEDLLPKRIGWVASRFGGSDKEALPQIPNPRFFLQAATYGPWYYDSPENSESSCSLKVACSEFGCQGLELDFVLMHWGSDLVWRGTWHVPERIARHREKPVDHTLNAYRVLLTRARDGLVIWCPDTQTREYLIGCGALLV